MQLPKGQGHHRSNLHQPISNSLRGHSKPTRTLHCQRCSPQQGHSNLSRILCHSQETCSSSIPKVTIRPTQTPISNSQTIITQGLSSPMTIMHPSSPTKMRHCSLTRVLTPSSPTRTWGPQHIRLQGHSSTLHPEGKWPGRVLLPSPRDPHSQTLVPSLCPVRPSQGKTGSIWKGAVLQKTSRWHYPASRVYPDMSSKVPSRKTCLSPTQLRRLPPTRSIQPNPNPQRNLGQGLVPAR